MAEEIFKDNAIERRGLIERAKDYPEYSLYIKMAGRCYNSQTMAHINDWLDSLDRKKAIKAEIHHDP